MSRATSGDTVRVHYTGSLTEGEVFDSSRERDPLELTLGEGQVIPGFERAIEGMEVGETSTTTVPAAEAYGDERPELRFEVSRDHFPEGVEPEVGQKIGLQQPDGTTVPVRLAAVGDSEITLDANHPLAGEALTFEIELVEIVGA